MKQILQSARSGEISVAEVPAPQVMPGCVLVRMAASLISAGTERASAEFSRKNLLQKANARPDLVREVITKIRRDGISSAWNAVHARLDQPSALGYSSAGIVLEVGEGINDLSVGERVACAGADYAIHAEFSNVPRLLVAPIRSDSISFEEAAFTTLGAVALHGMRTAGATIGDKVAVIGLGLVGQLTVQLLKAAGCRVLGMDINAARAELAKSIGADAVSTSAADFEMLCEFQSSGRGVDSVLITAETPSSDPANLAASIARDRGVVVAVGTVGMDLDRKLFYEKELDFRVSRSYGPGRYDAAYEQKGRDYPIGHVRWTENRNMEAFLQLLADRKLDVKSLITHRFPIERAQSAYELISERSTPSLGVVITYPANTEPQAQLQLVSGKIAPTAGSGQIRIGVLGAGSYATSTLLPALNKTNGVELKSLSAASGSHARHAAEKFGFKSCVTGDEQIIADREIDAVVIATRHHLHSAQVIRAMQAGKHVFCEKPLCLTWDELSDIVKTRNGLAHTRLLMVGFNRRFAPMALQMKRFLDKVGEPLAMNYRVNAGFIDPDHWVNDPEQGGGRILGEVCHFIDLLTLMAGSVPVEVRTDSLANCGRYSGDNVVVTLRFANGSQGTITYVANGDRGYSKERLEVFGGGLTAVLDDFRTLELVKDGRKQTIRSRFRQHKGHRAEMQAFVDAIRNGGQAPISFDDIVLVTRATFAAAESLRKGMPIPVSPPSL